jgi:uncharacterized protein GlcG (DUF336 family)
MAAGTCGLEGLEMKLTSEVAGSMIEAAEAKAAQLGIAVNIAVLDSGAHLKAFRRMDGAALGAIDLAIRKARTAALFQMNSEDIWEFVKPGAPAEGMQFSNGILVTFAGGVLLKSAQGEIVGALGVSGGTVPEDGEIVAAGAAAFTSPSSPAA